jgi:hypothetical protein
MAGDAPVSGADGSEVLDRWVARKVQPVVVLYLLVVFVAFIIVSHFIFRSPEAVKALIVAAIGAVAATVASVVGRIEYRLTASGIEKRVVDGKKPREFEEAFRWHELVRVVPMKHGFRYFKTFNETGPLRRFWNVHVSDRFSGEIHVEKHDLERIYGLVERLQGTFSESP